MPVDMPETALDRLARTPVVRSRFLAAMGTGVFAVAAKLVAPNSASAYHGSPPAPCIGFGVCHCCNGSTCCEANCSWTDHTHCSSGGQCWYACCLGTQYQCCDWHTKDGGGNLKHCICRGVVGSCGGGC